MKVQEGKRLGKYEMKRFADDSKRGIRVALLHHFRDFGNKDRKLLPC